MAAETTVTTMTGFFTTHLSRNWSNYAIDPNVAMLFARTEPVPAGGNIIAFARLTKDTALSGTITEGTGLSNTALDAAQVTATVAEVGIMRQHTKLDERHNMLGPEGLLEATYRDGVAMCLEKYETDLWGQWTNASTSVGTSGGAFTLANVVGAQSQHVVNKSRGEVIGLLPATAGKELRQEAIASGAGVFAAGAGNGLLQKPVDGYMGPFMGTEHYTSNLGTASGANTLGVYEVNGYNNPDAATGVGIGWMPEITPLWYNPVFSGGAQVAVTMAYGIVEVLDYAYVKTTTRT